MEDKNDNLQSLIQNESKEKPKICLHPKPEEPLPSDCCGSGCSPCVFDVYEKELQSWENECKQIRTGRSRSHTGPLSTCKKVSAISKRKYNSFELVAIERLNRDTCLYKFEIPENQEFLFDVGQHFILRSTDGETQISRPYTLISPPDTEGYFQVMIKLYPQGLMSGWISKWKTGNKIEWRGPFGEFTYKANQYSHISMLAAGTGIAPMLQIIRKVLDNENDETRLLLIYSCKRSRDILMKGLLDEFKSFWNFQVIYCITRKESEQQQTCIKYGDDVRNTRINEAVLLEELPQAAQGTKVLICGTESFNQDMANHVKKIGYEDERIFIF